MRPWRSRSDRHVVEHRTVRHPAIIAAAAIIAGAVLVGACSTGFDDATTATDSDRATSTTGADSGSSEPGEQPSPTRPATSEPTTTTALPADDPLGGFQPEPLAWDNCGALQCATLQVPLDWDDVDGDTLGLAIARRQARGDSSGSVLINPGGPGGSGIEFADYVFGTSDFDELTDNFDIVGWDPRGTNASEAVMCDASVEEFRTLDPTPDNAKETAELNDTANDIAEDCDREAANLLPNISTDATVNDMEAMRRALGDEQLSFYGFSYGTALGSFYADEFPERVRAIVLDGVVDPGADLETFLVAQTKGFEDALDALFESCGSSCPSGGADKLYDQLAVKVERDPIESGRRSLGPAELATAAISATYSPNEGRRFVQALVDAADDDPAALLALADQYYQGSDYTPYLAIECIDQEHPEGEAEWAEFVARLEEISPRLGGSIGYELLPCATWPVDPVPPRPFPTATGSEPILVVGNTGDAATPYVQAEAMAEGLDNAVLVTHEGTGHTSYGNRCVDEITAAYLVDLEVPDDGTVCRD